MPLLESPLIFPFTKREGPFWGIARVDKIKDENDLSLFEVLFYNVKAVL